MLAPIGGAVPGGRAERGQGVGTRSSYHRIRCGGTNSWGNHSIETPSNATAIDPMPAVRVSPKFQVVIPREVREAMQIEPGQQVEVLAYDHRIELIPVRPMPEMRGYLAGIDTSVERDADRAP